MSTTRFLLLAATIILIRTSAWGLPVYAVRSFGLITWNDLHSHEVEMNYTFARSVALAATYFRFSADEGVPQFGIGQLNYRALRLNGHHYQSNLYFFGGAGTRDFKGDSASAVFYGGEADYETRAVYIASEAKIFSSPDNITYQKYLGRVGVASHAGSFEELNDWLVVQVSYEKYFNTTKTTVTPLLRLFYKRFLGELGMSFTGEYMLNAAVHF